MSDVRVDLLVVGGGINGAGIAREAAGRGLSVVLVERDDLAAHTSSASSKLVHGGLRYLEHFELRLVRESLVERERLLRAAPHIVRPLEFVLPRGPGTRPPWMIRAGLFLYDHLGGGGLLPRARAVRLDSDERGRGLRTGVTRAYSYWDARMQDSRLVVINAIDAAERGATILTRSELIEARRDGGMWSAKLRGPGGERTLMARSIVNAAGPWTTELLERIESAQRGCKMRLVKGSHIVLPQLYHGEHAFLLQNLDGRVVFAIPFEGSFTLVGTTDVDWSGPPRPATISEGEIDYLLASVQRIFTSVASRDDIIWSYSGIRALVDDGASDLSKLTRDYRLELDVEGAPLLSVFGGKITTYRALAERALDQLAPTLGCTERPWTERAVLPGGDIPDCSIDDLSRQLAERHVALPPDLLDRFAHTYGTRTERLLSGIRSVKDLGEHFGAGLYAREVDYLVSNEWARTAEDVLFRRTKLGLHVDREAVDRLTAYLGVS